MASIDSKKVTISLPAELVAYADRKARERRSTRSGIIRELLQRMRDREVEELAREGYAFYARESDEFATTSARAVAEALDDEYSAR